MFCQHLQMKLHKLLLPVLWLSPTAVSACLVVRSLVVPWATNNKPIEFEDASLDFLEPSSPPPVFHSSLIMDARLACAYLHYLHDSIGDIWKNVVLDKLEYRCSDSSCFVFSLGGFVASNAYAFSQHNSNALVYSCGFPPKKQKRNPTGNVVMVPISERVRNIVWRKTQK